ncbi:MAG: hypothetical protein Q9171_006015 [Xanthocarpia ochracea]
MDPNDDWPSGPANYHHPRPGQAYQPSAVSSYPGGQLVPQTNVLEPYNHFYQPWQNQFPQQPPQYYSSQQPPQSYPYQNQDQWYNRDFEDSRKNTSAQDFYLSKENVREVVDFLQQDCIEPILDTFLRMADPLSIAASVLTVAGAGIKLTTALYTLVDAMRNANMEIELMTSEITVFSCTLDEVHDHMTTSRSLYSTNLMTNLKKLLETCTRVYSEIERILKLGKAGKSYRLTNHLMWALRREKLRPMRLNLESLKTTLMVMLQTMKIVKYKAKIQDQQSLDQDESDQPDGAPRRTQELQTLQRRERQTRLRAEALVIVNYWAVLDSQAASQAASQQGLLTQGPDSETSSSMETNLWLWQLIPYRPPNHEHRIHDRIETASTKSLRTSASKTVHQLVKTWTNDVSTEPNQKRLSSGGQPNADISQVPLGRVPKPLAALQLEIPAENPRPQTISQSEVINKDDGDTVQKAHSPELTPTNDPQVQHPTPRDESQHGSERVKTKSARVQSPGLSVASHTSYNITIEPTSRDSDSTVGSVHDSSISRRTSSSWDDISIKLATGKDIESQQQARLEAVDKLEDSDSFKEYDPHRDSTRPHRPSNPFPMDQARADPFPSLPQGPNTLTHTFPPRPLYPYYPRFQATPSSLPVPAPAPVQSEVPTTNGPDDDKKFARLEKLMMEFKEEQAAREAAEIRRKEDERAAEAAHAREKSLLERERAVADIEKTAKKTSGVKQVIKLKDAVGRNHRFPFANCRTWEGIHYLICDAFLHVEGLGPHVSESHYDLLDPSGNIILPLIWEDVIEPGWTISMHMWPIAGSPGPAHVPSIHETTEVRGVPVPSPPVSPPKASRTRNKKDSMVYRRDAESEDDTCSTTSSEDLKSDFLRMLEKVEVSDLQQWLEHKKLVLGERAKQATAQASTVDSYTGPSETVPPQQALPTPNYAFQDMKGKRRIEEAAPKTDTEEQLARLEHLLLESKRDHDEKEAAKQQAEEQAYIHKLNSQIAQKQAELDARDAAAQAQKDEEKFARIEKLILDRNNGPSATMSTSGLLTSPPSDASRPNSSKSGHRSLRNRIFSRGS